MLETPQMFQSILPNIADHIELSEPYSTNYSLQKTTFYWYKQQSLWSAASIVW
jgi:hypothetical protein